MKAFVKAICSLFEQCVKGSLLHFSQLFLTSGELGKLIGVENVRWKTAQGNEMTTIVSPFGKIRLPQLQVKDKDTGRRYYITRLLLGVEKWKRIPEITRKYFGLLGSLASLRVVNKFFSLFCGMKVSLMSIVRAIRAVGEKIVFNIDPEETNEFEADGTGLPILGTGKRGKELEILAQRKEGGGIRIAGMILSSYKKGWEKLFEPLKAGLKAFKEIFLVTDGDTSPLKGLDKIKVILQRCLFHIPHELKYTLWKDKVKRKSTLWVEILAKLYEITRVKRIYDDETVLKEVIKRKGEQLEILIEKCKENGLKASVSYLEEAKADIFSGVERRISGGTTSLIERVMRTVNQRINIAVWSEQSAPAVAKIRGAYYYNGFDV